MRVKEKKHNSILTTIKENFKEFKSGLSFLVAPDSQSELEEFYNTDTIDNATLDELIDTYNNVESKIRKQEMENKRQENTRTVRSRRLNSGGAVSRINTIDNINTGKAQRRMPNIDEKGKTKDNNINYYR